MKILIPICVVLLMTLANGESTFEPATLKPTKPPTTIAPTTAAPTTAAKTTTVPSTVATTTAAPTTAAKTTTVPSTAATTTAATTTAATTTAATTTAATTTVATTTAATTTAATTTAAPVVPPAKWIVKDSKGKPCILADFNTVFSGFYTTVNKTEAPFSFVLPPSSSVDAARSECGTPGSKNAVLVLTFDDGDSFTQEFKADTSSKKFVLYSASANLTHDEAHFNGSSDEGKVITYGGLLPNAAFGTSLGSYYRCAAKEKVEFTKPKFAISYTNLTIQPFDVKDKFGKMSACAADTPTVKPDTPPVGSWNVTQDKKLCMRMSFAADLFINYTMKNGSMSTAGIYLPVKTLSTSGSTCSNDTAVFVMKFAASAGYIEHDDWKITMTFKMNKTDKNYAMSNFAVEYNTMDNTIFPDVNVTAKVNSVNKTKRFQTGQGNYYLCDADTSVTASLFRTEFSHLKLQPFAGDIKDGSYGTASDCAADNTVSNIVPIAVGCALAGLVIIVLIAYLIGRSRTNRSGYQSV